MSKKGITLIEILVASAVFMTLMGLVVGSFIALTNAKSLSVRMRNSQEKLRVSLDMISRLSRQASDVNIVVAGGEQRLILTNNPTDGQSIETGAQFIIEAPNSAGLSNLYYLECSGLADCSNSFSTRSKTLGQNLLGGASSDVKLIVGGSNGSTFKRTFVDNIPYLDVILNSSTGSQTKSDYSDSLYLETGVVIGESY